MKKMSQTLLSLLLMLFVSIVANANITIRGKVVDATTNEPVYLSTIRVRQINSKNDSVYLQGANTKENGSFLVSLDKSKRGADLSISVSFVGYTMTYKHIKLSSQKKDSLVDIGEIRLQPSEIVLQGVNVKGKVAQVTTKEDTFIYNAAAYRTPEGSYLEALVEKLPGAVIDEDGKITINGKEVSQILVDGKDFFKSDKDVALKNIPVDIIEKIKAYDKKSDYTEQTGIDDGNEQTVLDVSMKEKIKTSTMSNVDLGIGTKKRYAENIFANRYTDNSRISLIGGANNTNGRGMYGGGPGFRGGGNGLTASKNIGLDGFWNNGKKEKEGGYFQIGGSVFYRHNSTDVSSRSNSETFLNGSSNKSSFGNSRSGNKGSNGSVNIDLKLDWRPDTLTRVSFRPAYSHSNNESTSENLSATFNDNPYNIKGMQDPLDSIFSGKDTELSKIAINRNKRKSLSDSNSDSFSGELNITRKLNQKGRSISLRLNAASSSSSNKSYSLSQIYYYQGDSANNYYQYSTSPSKNWNYSARLSYTEPLLEKLFLQTSYSFERKYQDSNRELYKIQDPMMEELAKIGGLTHEDSTKLEQDFLNSQYATYYDNIHRGNIGLRYVDKTLNVSAGVTIENQNTKLSYTKNQKDYEPTRNITNISPNVRFRWKISDVSAFNFRYRGSSSQPSMTSLLDIVDTSDPLNISMGNPDLEPSWTNRFEMEYRNYWQETQTSLGSFITYSNTSNSISNAMIYNEETGVRTTKPENINGNWDMNAHVMFNTALGESKSFNLGNYLGGTYRNQVGFISTQGMSSEKNTVKSTSIREHLRFSYRNDVIEVGLNGGLNYTYSRSKLQSRSDLDTYNFSYGTYIQLNLPLAFSISTDLGMNSRRGYSDDAMNTNELLWNAQLSKSFFKDKRAVISLQMYDLLHKQSNISRTLTANQRSDRWTNSINSYFMLHFIYRFNLFFGEGGKKIKNENNISELDSKGPKGPGMSGQGMGRSNMGGGGMRR